MRARTRGMWPLTRSRRCAAPLLHVPCDHDGFVKESLKEDEIQYTDPQYSSFQCSAREPVELTQGT